MSRGRKGSKSRRSGQRVRRAVEPVATEPCDCPACTGEEAGPQQFVDDLLAGLGELPAVEDPLEAELFGATLIAAVERFAVVMREDLVPGGTPESLALVLALGAVDDGPPAADTARRLIEAGVPAPGWADELREPVRLDECRLLADSDGTTSMLICSFERAGRTHGFLVHVDRLACDSAGDILLFPGAALEEMVEEIRADGRRAGLEITEAVLDPAEFRWQTERALDARAVHDQENTAPLDDFEDEDGPGYPPLAVLLRSRMRSLPEPPRPPAPHGNGERAPGFHKAALSLFADRLQAHSPRRRAAAGPQLPAKRRKSDGPAPIHQLKVSLRDAQPPIWRRLEVPADTGLAALHQIIQTAFGWDDSHLHVFETTYGSFGVADRELGHRAEGPVTLEQVAPGSGDSLQYTYDFGDDWTHEIVVEKVREREPVAYPRCTDGGRAAPPEDCGGVWGYTALVEVLSNPDHPEHADRVEWLGLDSAADFDPARFDAAEITRALEQTRTGPRQS